MLRHTIATVLCTCSLATSALGGPISPPVGPVASTYKTLTEVEPRIAINAANAPGDNDAITPSVFKISQPGSYYLTGNISVTQAKIAIEVTVSDVTIDLNGFSLIGNSIATNGVYANTNSTSGLHLKNGSISGFVTHGINAEAMHAALITEVRISTCGFGARLGSGVIVRNCTFDSNAGTGLHMSGDGTVAGCTATRNATGFSVQGWASISDSSAISNTGDGFSILFGGALSNCSACLNGSDGFWIQGGTTITNCTARGNAAAGIFLNGSCTATNNTSTENATGIHAANSGCRIDSNHVYGNTGIGINSVFDNNFIVRNSARANGTNYSIPAGDYAQIITNPGNAFVATNPWANFAY